MFRFVVLLLFVPAAWVSAQPNCQVFAENGRRLMAQKKYEGAILEFERSMEACPQQQLLLLDLAQALMFQRKFGDAARAANQFLAADPHSEQGLLVLANVHFMSQNFQECQKIVGRILARDNRNTAALKMKANVHYLLGEEPEAVETFLAAVEVDPKDEDAIYSLGRVYYQQNRFEPAIAQFKRVLNLNPKSYKAYDNLGLCYEALSRDEEAIRHYLKALDLVHNDHRDYDWPYANLANLLLKRDDNEKAFSLAAEAAERNPYSARNFYLGGKALARLEKLDLSAKWLKRSIELDPSYPEPHYLLAQVYQKQGRKEEAQREFQAFQEINAKTPRRRR